MKSYKKFWKMTLGFGLLMTLILPSAGLANAKTNALPIELNSVRDNKDLRTTRQLVEEYLEDCADLDKESGTSSATLKKCVTILKSVGSKVDATHSALETITGKIKNEKKWTQELDDDFEKNAARRGVDANLISEVKGEGGFRAFYKKGIAAVQSSKPEIDAGIKKLEAKIKETAVLQDILFQKKSFQMISFAPKSLNRSESPSATLHSYKFVIYIIWTIEAICSLPLGGRGCN